MLDTAGQPLWGFDDPGGSVNSVAFSRDGRLLAVGDAQKNENKVLIFDVVRRKQLAALSGHDNGVNSVAFSPDGRILASGGIDQVILWDTVRWTKIRALPGWANTVAFSPDGETIALGNSAGQGTPHVVIWDVAGAFKRIEFDLQAWVVSSVAFSPDGRALTAAGVSSGLSGAAAAHLDVWDALSGTTVESLRSHTGRVNAVAFSPDGMAMASGSDDGYAILWSAVGSSRVSLTLATLGR